MKRIVFLGCIFICIFTSIAQENNAKYIWPHQKPDVRNEYVYFRYEFDLSQTADIADIHLFVDSRYQLFVNEIYMNFGPARSYPEHPEFDSYDIKQYLRPGKNVIAVKALYNGIENFQVPDNRPGFIAWGSVQNGEEKFSLSTPGKWKCLKSTGYDQYAMRFSFACAAMEVFDARNEPHNFNAIDLNTSKWKKPVVLKNQKAWGKLAPRSIPHLTKKEIFAKNIIGMHQLNEDEDLYMFRIKTPDEKRRDYNRNPSVIGYTYIYSPKDQDVEIGLWWGEFYLNGEGPLKGLGEKPERLNRDPRIFKLKKGWNFFNMHYGAVWGGWDFYMAIPKTAGLHVSPTKVFDSKYIFMTTGPLPWERNAELKQLDRPFNTLKALKKAGKTQWNGQVRDGVSHNPALDMVWKYSNQELKINDWQTEDIQVEPGPGTAIVYDMGAKTLGRVIVEFDAPEGTVIDMGISEDLYNNKPTIYKRKSIAAANRCITDGKMTRFESFKPYGFRYLQLNITGNNRPVFIKKVGVVEQIYPFEKLGSFECSDPMMNAIWEIGWRTVRVCAEDSYTDTPFRERGMYAGDMLPEYAITLAGNGDSRLLKRSLKVFHDKYKNIMSRDERYGSEGEFPLINILSSKWYYDYSGDKEFVRFVYEGYKNLVDRWLNSKDENGICFVYRHFIEWTKINKNAKLAAANALLAQTADIVADYAEVLDKAEDVEYYREQAKILRQTVADKFWDPQKELFNDGYVEGKLKGQYYPASNAWPLLYGCASKAQIDKVLEYLESELKDIGEESRNRRTTPYSAFYILSALYQQERADIAERFIKQYWTRMIVKGDDTTWENFDIDYGTQGTASHAWSGHPTYFLTTEALGVNLGFHKELSRNKIIIAPQSENLTWAKGAVPHPAGLVYVDWKVEGNALLLNYKAPENIEVVVAPKGRLAEKVLWVNGVKR